MPWNFKGLWSLSIVYSSIHFRDYNRVINQWKKNVSLTLVPVQIIKHFELGDLCLLQVSILLLIYLYKNLIQCLRAQETAINNLT